MADGQLMLLNPLRADYPPFSIIVAMVTVSSSISVIRFGLTSVTCVNNNNNNNNTLNNFYVTVGTVVITQVILRVRPDHLMNVEQREAAADPQTKPPDLGCESPFTIAIYYYSTRKLILFYHPTEAESTYVHPDVVPNLTSRA